GSMLATATAMRDRRSGLLLDELLPALQVAVADGAVHVDHALLEALEELEVERTVVHGLLDLEDETDGDERHEVGRRVEEAVDALPDAVADRHRLEERQDEEGARAVAVEAERLAEIFTALLDALVLRDV